MDGPLLLDCDPGIDDMVALLVACSYSDVDIAGVSTVGGNVGLAATTRNARAVLALAGRPQVPVAAGADRPLVRGAPARDGSAHGADGLGGAVLPEPAGAPDPRHAVDLMAEVVAGAERPVTLVATGPLTNVALFYARHPQLAARLQRLVVMGGAAGAGNVTAAAEFNIWFDPEAAHRVLSDPGLPVQVPTTVVGLDVTLRAGLGPADLAALAGGGRAAALVARAFTGYRHGAVPAPGHPPVTPVHDAVTLLAVLLPGLVSTRPASVEVDTSTGPMRGRTIVEFDPPADTVAPVVQFAVAADQLVVAATIVDRLGRLDTAISQ